MEKDKPSRTIEAMRNIRVNVPTAALIDFESCSRPPQLLQDDRDIGGESESGGANVRLGLDNELFASIARAGAGPRTLRAQAGLKRLGGW